MARTVNKDTGLGERVLALRKRKGMTQLDLANAINANVNYVSYIERGVTKSPSSRRLNALAEALGTTSDILLTPDKEVKSNMMDRLLMKNYSKLGDRDKACVRGVVELLTNLERDHDE